MTDVFSKKKRSEVMASIKGKDTKPELIVRRLLHSLGYRYRLHAKSLPSKPDIYFAGRRKAILVHGCFWHGHQGCSRATLPKSNADFWKQKIGRNVERDAAGVVGLKKLGVKSLVIWQCETKDRELLQKRLVKFLGLSTSTKP
jgi:DNA mismatch endonuclease (patch repair protein)